MRDITSLLHRITQRISINLREQHFDIHPYVERTIPLSQMIKFYAFYGITPHHPLNFHFSHSSLAGSYFLGKCSVDHSILYKSDIRGDELKHKGDIFPFENASITVHEDEAIDVRDSFLIKTLVHNFSHDPESLENFFIHDTLAMHYANIHGSPTEGCFMEPFSTVDLTTQHDCVIGRFSYIQVGEMSHLKIPAGTIWIRKPGAFNFLYRFPQHILDRYILYDPISGPPRGIFMDFLEARKADFKRVFDVMHIDPSIKIPAGASLDRYAVVKPKVQIGENVLVAQRSYLENCWMGKGANAQENCYIINSRLEGYDVTAHGAKLIHSMLDRNVFVGFNSFIRGQMDHPVRIGKGCIVMPHTIIDTPAGITIPDDHLVWGIIESEADLPHHSMAIEQFSRISEGLMVRDMMFEGDGAAFVHAFRHRIEHILEANGAYFDGIHNQGHAQKNRFIAFNTIQPYPDGDRMGMYPTIDIRP
ncbi:transferase [Desulfatirhabdium butyrativorans]|uniref:transferase n=1 Tax=Desulfatirhabdium butyrativorans TaxID=340467 RepID=UPI0003F87558|nr:transferase [Desulfatirhabdium butyrativorans]